MLSAYGNFRTRTFTDIYPDVQTFLNEYANNGIPTTIQQSSCQTLYYLMYSRYGNSHIANNDENQFKYKVFSIIFMYGPTWEKRLDIQNKLRQMSEDELRLGAKQIYNHSFNPSTPPSTDSKEELDTIDDQNITHYKKSRLDAYANLLALLETDVTEELLARFKKLFIQIVEPQLPLWYVTELEDQDGRV